MHKQVERAFWAQRLQTAIVKDMGRQYEVEQEPGDDDFRAVSASVLFMPGYEVPNSKTQVHSRSTSGGKVCLRLD